MGMGANYKDFVIKSWGKIEGIEKRQFIDILKYFGLFMVKSLGLSKD